MCVVNSCSKLCCTRWPGNGAVVKGFVQWSQLPTWSLDHGSRRSKGCVLKHKNLEIVKLKPELKLSDQSELLLHFFGEGNDDTTRRPRHITCQGQRVWLSRVGRYVRRHLVRAPVQMSLCLFPTLHGRECQCFHAHWLRLQKCARKLCSRNQPCHERDHSS